MTEQLTLELVQRPGAYVVGYKTSDGPRYALYTFGRFLCWLKVKHVHSLTRKFKLVQVEGQGRTLFVHCDKQL